jgi:DNA-binding NarL/FixJ family response regulator
VTRIRLFLADDQEVFRLGLRKLFEESKKFSVVGEACNAANTVAQVNRLKPDVVLMNVQLPDESGIEVCRHIRSAHPHVRVLLLTSLPDEEALMASSNAGASGFVTKKIAGEELIRAVQTITVGECVVDSTMTDIIVRQMQLPSVSETLEQDVVEFPPQQRRVLALLAEGKTNREIAMLLDLSERTVIGYVRIIFRKLRLTRRSQAAVYFTKYSSRASHRSAWEMLHCR